MRTAEKSYDVIIVGAGPAGTSAAIHLANQSTRVLLVEQRIFPRAKLCGEFISPECVAHFAKLGVAVEMESSQPAQISETVFYSRHGRRIVVPSRWFGGAAALGLSRAAMDDNLMKRAKAVGVDVLEETAVTDLIEGEAGVCGVRLKKEFEEHDHRASVIIDATGRSRALVRKVKKLSLRRRMKPKLVAFKAHFVNTRVAGGTCEIYSYPGGYGGLSTVENGLSNLCFIVDAADVRRAHSDPATVLRENVMRNRRAAFTLDRANVCTPWLSVSLESFGRQCPTPANGLLAIGDSAAFIDPFTGSGMLMALESGQLVSDLIVRHRDKLKLPNGVATLSADYAQEYRHKFDSRLRASSLVRCVAFRPLLAQLAITVCGSSDQFRGWLARATRARVKDSTSPRLT